MSRPASLRCNSAAFLLSLIAATAPSLLPAQAQQPPRANLVRLPASELERTSFNQVSAATVTASGTLVVLDGGDSELREFTLRGDALKSFGRRGRGPGEFMRATDLAALRGDRVAVHDAVLRRITVFGPGRTPDTTVSVGFGVRCCLPDGFFLEGVTPQPSRADSTLNRFLLRSMQGVSGSPFLTLRSQPQRVAAVSRNSPSGHFEFSGVHRMPFSGDPFVVFTQRGIVAAGPGYRTVELFATTGSVVNTFRSTDRAIAIPRAVMTRAVDSVLALSPEQERSALRAAFARATLPVQYPVFTAARADDSHLWLRRHDPARSTEHWIRYDYTGAPQLSIMLAAHEHALAFHRDTIVVRHEDRNTGEHRLRRYQLVAR